MRLVWIKQTKLIQCFDVSKNPKPKIIRNYFEWIWQTSNKRNLILFHMKCVQPNVITDIVITWDFVITDKLNLRVLKIVCLLKWSAIQNFPIIISVSIITLIKVIEPISNPYSVKTIWIYFFQYLCLCSNIFVNDNKYLFVPYHFF